MDELRGASPEPLPPTVTPPGTYGAAENDSERAERLRASEDLSAMRVGIAQADAGHTRPALEALVELRKKHRL
jgi:hypothetical protein